MYSHYKKSPYTNTVSIRNNDIEVPFGVSQAGPGNYYHEHQDGRRGRRYGQMQIDCKTPAQTNKLRVGAVSSGNKFASVHGSTDFSICNRELLENSEFGLEFDTFDFVNETAKSIDNINWPELKLAMKNKKPDQKNQNSPKLLDVALQTDKYNLELKYPLWNIREIAQPVEDDMPIFKQNKVTRGTQIENIMFMKREYLHDQEPPDETLILSSTSAQNHKTYADVVQRDVTKLEEGFRLPDPVTVTEMKTFFKIKDIRREFSQFRDFSSRKIHSEKFATEKRSPSKDDGVEMNTVKAVKGNEERDVFSFEELVQCLTGTGSRTEVKTAEEEKFGCSRINTGNKYSYQEIGDAGSVLKTANDFFLMENERPFMEDNPKNLFQPSYLSYSKDSFQNVSQDAYYSFNQVMLRAKAEIIATEGFDLETAFNIARYLWKRRKLRLPYTRFLTKSSTPSSLYEVRANFEPCQQIQHPFPNWAQKGCQYLPDYDVERKCTPIVYESEKQVSSRYLVEMQVREIRHQYVSPVTKLRGQSLYSGF
jgi:6-pyruvoyl-tetrahydropterin synthase